MKKLLLAVVAAALGLPGVGHAQAIWNPSYPNTWAPGAYQPSKFDEPFSHRYNYYSGPSWFLGINGAQATQLEYLDRVDRAERFGRPIPPPPVYREPLLVRWKRQRQAAQQPVFVDTPKPTPAPGQPRLLKKMDESEKVEDLPPPEEDKN